MGTQPEQPDDLPNDADEARVAWLLTSACSAPALREEFARELSAKLQAEFEAEFPNAIDRHALNGHASNGQMTNGHSNNGHLEAEACESLVIRRASYMRRWMMGVAAAASALVAITVWADPPGWKNMVRSIVSTIERFTVGEADVRPIEQVLVHGNTAEVPVANQPVAEERAVAVTIADEVKTLADAAPEKVAASSAVPRPATVMSVPPAIEQSRVEKPKWKPFEKPLEPTVLTQRVNEQLAAFWAGQRIVPVAGASDAEFMRRVYLDLLGRVPSVGEAREFLSDSTPERRAVLVDRLLAHHDHATHFAAVWRRILLPDEVDLSRLGGSAQFEQWLAEKFAANVPYDQIVRELLLAEGRVSESGPLLFYAAVRLNPEELAGRTSRAFLGVRMECAQCHDHPFDEISQKDFWSFAAFFARISRPRGKMEMTSPVLAVRDNARGDVMIPESDEVVPPRLPGSVIELAEEAEGPSRREQLVAWLTARDNQHFAQATVNRVWAHLFGRGLVEPVDDMRPANPAICPELLDLLARDFAASGFDLRRLCRELVLSDAYQLASGTQTGGSDGGDPSRTLVFAQMNIKSLTAEQLYDCIAVATGRAALAGDADAAALAGQGGLARFADTSRQAFIEQFRTSPGQVTDYQAGIPQALTLMHGGLIHGATDVAASGLLKSLAAPFFKDDQRLETLYLATLSRYPEREEREVLVKQLAAATNRAERQQMLGDLLWALLNSAEFTLNH
jgi:hypothetical protein